jgi:LacI family transcriptional regulator
VTASLLKTSLQLQCKDIVLSLKAVLPISMFNRCIGCKDSANEDPMARSSSAKLEDIAKKLKVSVSTVSRALSGHPGISAATRASVQEAAAAAGYRIPAQARSTRKAATKMVGVVIGALHNRFMTQLLEHLHDALQDAGYQVTLLIDSMRDPAQLLAFRPLIEGYLDGMIFATATLDSPVVAELRRRGVPLVLVVRSVDGVQVDTVEVDNVQAGIEVARHLWALGHRRIGIVAGPQNTSTSRNRVLGILRFFEEQGQRLHDVPVLWGEYTTESGYSNAMKLLSADVPVSAICAGNDTVALGVLEAARRRGVAVPERLSVIGFDDIALAGSPLVSLTTVRQPVREMARTAARRLVERMRPGFVGPAVREVLPIELIRRDTTGPAPTR